MEQDGATRARSVGEDEDEPLRAARARAEEADIPAVAPETGQLLRFFARLVEARHVAEIGSGSGYSGLWLLGGMHARGALTTIEADPDHQALAQRAYAEAGQAGRVRSMLGAPLAILGRLADANYDLLLVDGAVGEHAEYAAHAARLLHPGGLLLVHGAGSPDGAPTLADAIAEDPTFRAVLLPTGDGVLAAIRS